MKGLQRAKVEKLMVVRFIIFRKQALGWGENGRTMVFEIDGSIDANCRSLG